MSHRKRRRRWTPAQKLQIVLETLQSDPKLAEICQREGVSPNLVYQRRRQLLASADVVFTPSRHTSGHAQRRPSPSATRISSSLKAGNRYQARWTVVCTARVLHGEYESIRLEQPGLEGQGVEFCLRRGAAREYHQVKRRHARSGHGPCGN